MSPETILALFKLSLDALKAVKELLPKTPDTQPARDRIDGFLHRLQQHDQEVAASANDCQHMATHTVLELHTIQLNSIEAKLDTVLANVDPLSKLIHEKRLADVSQDDFLREFGPTTPEAKSDESKPDQPSA